MGARLPKPVTSVVVKRWGGADQQFRVGFAEMNGQRPTQEDAHAVVMQSTCGFFAVLDGHGGSACSSFVASRLTEELERGGVPGDDEAMKALALRLDAEFLQTRAKEPSGSTATFVIVTAPVEAGGKYRLRVGNLGDSRVLLGRADGTMVEGSGSDGGLTTDHKPSQPEERRRIERTGGKVLRERVNGELAVSRAFGDGQYKLTGGPLQEDRPVTAAPEFFHHECSPPDFVMLVCDGITECNFPNRSVVQLAAEELKKTIERTGTDGGAAAVDPGAAAAAVCRTALERGSMDNLSCMIVLLGEGGGAMPGKERELLPGACDLLHHDAFRKAYAAMAERAGMTLVEAVEARYGIVEEMKGAFEVSLSRELQQETAAFAEGPPEGLAVGSEERTQWFAGWVQEQIKKSANRGQVLTRPLLVRPPVPNASQVRPPVPNATQGGDVAVPAWRVPVVAAEEGVVRGAFQAHALLQWEEAYRAVSGEEGVVLKRDDAGNTSQVKFRLGGLTVWFPNEALRPPRAQVAGLKQLRGAIEESAHVDWNEEKHSLVQGQQALVLKMDDSKKASLIKLPDSEGELWVPSSTLTRMEGGADAGQADAKRPRTE